ncbi:hypothetical protein KMP13_02450 [Epibacterium ulvae]|uniref:hypothetical protein n=1 Tax=Epibacterium ulvae TaxID=1156985 RepID=UPI001BFC8A15|nr:hypothetical protein [Epibacterium ulvae]MBT8152773.1 hypothetical protein [Epibacterium ulvae]
MSEQVTQSLIEITVRTKKAEKAAMGYTKSNKLPPSGSPGNGVDAADGVGIKSLVDHALDCARNSNFQEAREALEQAKQRLKE